MLFILLFTGCHLYGQTNFSNLKIVECKGKYGLTDSLGKIFLPAKYYSISELQHGLVSVKMYGKYALANYELGKEFTPAIYDNIIDISSGLLLVEVNNSEGIVDHTGKEIIPIKYDKVKSTFEDIIIVQKNERKGIFNAQEK